MAADKGELRVGRGVSKGKDGAGESVKFSKGSDPKGSAIGGVVRMARGGGGGVKGDWQFVA